VLNEETTVLFFRSAPLFGETTLMIAEVNKFIRLKAEPFLYKFSMMHEKEQNDLE